MTRRLFSEWLGTLFLVMTVVGSGIMAQQLSGGNVAIALLGNTIATGAILVVLITIFGPISGAHFNPAVTFGFWIQDDIQSPEAILYIIFQIFGGIIGALLAHFMFELPIIQTSETVRAGMSQGVAEFIATFGLMITILGCIKAKPEAVPYAVGLFITAGYWFTSSTSFANPAVTLARTSTNTFSGIAPENAMGFIIAQLTGAAIAVLIFTWLLKETNEIDNDKN